MEIKINDSPLDYSLDNENTLGEVLANLEGWLVNSGHRIVNLFIDDTEVDASMLEEAFSKKLDTIKSIKIKTNIIADLTAESLQSLLEDIDDFENLKFDEKKNFYDKWKESAQAQYISVEITDLYAYCVNTFLNGDLHTVTLRSIVEEIIREVSNPVDELKKIESILNEICERLVDLPLDIQTGKDSRAAQTIQLFSAITEKIFRIVRQLDTQNYLSKADEIKPITQLITEFGNILKDLLEAYEKNDSVLVGDLTEYEASPKIKELYNAILARVNI